MKNDNRPAYTDAANKISEILRPANGMSCEFRVFSEADRDALKYPDFTFDSRGHILMAGDWYVIITCANG